MSVLTTKRQPNKNELLASFTNGIVPDSELYKQEIAVQKAWANGLFELNVLNSKEFHLITDALETAYILMEKKQFEWRQEDEDIHMNIERFVNEKTDGLGKKMHVGRSRNDLIATTLKLHVADSSQEVIKLMNTLIEVILNLADKNSDVIIPGMTHLQNGQPVRWSHALLSHAWTFKRDVKKFKTTFENAMEVMPLGSAALSGTTLNINLKHIAQTLGFNSTAQNSYDSVGERDSIVDFLQASSHFGVHLSRFCEDIIYWSSSPVELVQLSPSWSTGSSIMPNKRNPDVAELARAKSSLWMGSTSGVMTLIKGLPTCYASDLHESKIPYLSVAQDIKLTLKVLSPFIAELKVNREQAQTLLNKGHILATEICNHLTHLGIPFREAYGVVAALVEVADSKKVQIHEIELLEMQKIAPQITQKFLDELTFEATVEKRLMSGGTALSEVKKQIQNLNASILSN